MLFDVVFYFLLIFSVNLALCVAIINLRNDEWRKIKAKMCQYLVFFRCKRESPFANVVFYISVEALSQW
jgi:hypothetical protein